MDTPNLLTFDQDEFNHNLNNFNNITTIEEKETDLNLNIDLSNEVNKNVVNISYEPPSCLITNDVVLIDNTTNNVIKLENYKKVDVMFTATDENFKCSTTSLNSENLSSPMQTSTDVYLDSEILSTDVASNDSQSPKNLLTQTKPNNFQTFSYENEKPQEEKTIEFNIKKSPQLFGSNDSLSNLKSDQSLLNSGESCGSSPIHKINRDYKKIRKHKKKYFGVKTLQSIFNKNGYSDISSTASEVGDEVITNQPTTPTMENCNKEHYSETSAQFEENIHTILSDIFVKNFTITDTVSQQQQQQQQNAQLTKLINKPAGIKKHFSMHGQHLRVGKALRLCPNEEITQTESEQRKEKLLARYVYNANSIHADGVGDPDFGTPV